MRLKLIACKSLFREFSRICAVSDHVVDVTWIRQGKHDTPEDLHRLLQAEIDAVESGADDHTNQPVGGEDFDAILLGYGLCSNAAAGLSAKNHRLVIPRAHDCITLLLGSKERYAEYFRELPGCFWYTASWIDSSDMPGPEQEARMERELLDQGFDEEMVELLMEDLAGFAGYHHAAYIRMPFFDRDRYREITKTAAEHYGWEYHEVEGDPSLMERMIAGDWDPEDFLVLEPGETSAQASGAEIIKNKDS